MKICEYNCIITPNLWGSYICHIYFTLHYIYISKKNIISVSNVLHGSLYSVRICLELILFNKKESMIKSYFWANCFSHVFY